MLDCTQWRTWLTTWYNVFLYLFLIKYHHDENYSFLYTYLLFSIPLVIIGEYLVWFTKMWKKCGMTLKRAIFQSFIGHWLPFLIYVYFTHKYNTPKMDNIVLIFVLFLFIAYNSIYDLKERYDI